MTARLKANQQAQKRRRRVRGKLHGTTHRPRLSVFRSNKFTYLQVIDDEQGQTLAAANDKTVTATGTKLARARLVATALADQLKQKKVKRLSFDRGSCRYHGRLAAVAQVMREAGVEV